MTTILRAKPLVSSRIHSLKAKVADLKQMGITPKMRVILVGDNTASLSYVGRKEKLCQKVGCEFELLRLPEDVERETFLLKVNEANQDPDITGCFVQLPVPQQLKDIDVTRLIAPEKDVDGFGTASIVDIYKGSDPLFVPCTPKGILQLLDHHNIEVAGKSVVVLGRSLIVGKPMALLLQNRNATVTMCHSQTANLRQYTRQADIIISAVGKPKFLDKSYFNSELNQIVVDVGICRDSEGNLCGDVDFGEVSPLVAAITPVPGGVGPLTVLSLIENLILASELKSNGNKENFNKEIKR